MHADPVLISTLEQTEPPVNRTQPAGLFPPAGMSGLNTIEQLGNRVGVCPHSIKAFANDLTITMLPCQRWKCPVCGPIEAWRWARRVRYGIALSGHTAFFWTLTMPPRIKTAKLAYSLLPGQWSRLREQMRYRVGTWDYVAFVEEHPRRSFIPHLHVISVQPAPERLKDLAVRCGFGYQAKDEKLTGPRAAAYVSKYVTKAGHAMPVGFRRVRTSQSWPRLPDAEVGEVFRPKQREPLTEFFTRVALATNTPPNVLRDRWISAVPGTHGDDPSAAR